MPATDPGIRRRVARIGGHAAQAKHGGLAMTTVSRAAIESSLNARLIAEHDIDVNASDFAARLKSARSAHFGALALRRSK